MKKIFLILMPLLITIFFTLETSKTTMGQNNSPYDENKIVRQQTSNYQYPSFYKGIYLTIDSGRSHEKLSNFVQKAKESSINTFVIDIQTSHATECMVPKENVDLCLKNNIHPIARIVVFADGLKKYPVPEKDILIKMQLAETACKSGFKEIQFDYIRFNDYGVLRRLSLKEKYDFIEGFLERARNHLKKYDVKIAADIFGRIPLNTKDEIGQRMEGLDRVVDIICPMAYPSHYTWSAQLMADPYQTVYITSKKAKERVKNAEIVAYIQAFKMKLGVSKLSFEKYIEAQLQAVHDAGIRGYLLWNARQDYNVPFAVVKGYYAKDSNRISHLEKEKKATDSSI